MIQKGKSQTIIHSHCICRKNAEYVPFITYKGETTFKDYEGIIIGKCKKCKVLKTLSSTTIPTQSHIDIYKDQEQEYQKLFKPLIEVIKKNKSRANVLDVGCSNGILLQMLEKQKYKVWGIEPNKNAFKEAQKHLGKHIFMGTTKDFFKNKHYKYDVIIYNHVMEHVEDINREFLYIKRLLAPDGLLVIGVPNTNNFIFLLRKKFWESLLPLEHRWHFSDTYLVEYIKKNNFKILQTFYSNHSRHDYPLLKKIYFKILCLFNRLFHTGEAVVIVAKL